MANTDTINLLKECDAGAKMAVSSINEVLEHIQDEELMSLLMESRDKHAAYGDKLHSLLISEGSNDKEPAAMAKSMSWLKSNFKMTLDNSDSTISDLITDGCDMGIKSLYRYKNKYASADEESKNLCMMIASIEEDLRIKLRKYL